MSITTLNALESPSTQTYQNVSALFRNLVRNRTNSSFDFLPLIFTTYDLIIKSNSFDFLRIHSFRYRTEEGNFYQITADMSFPGNISANQISDIITPILSNLPPQFNATYDNRSSLVGDDIQPLNRKTIKEQSILN